MAVQSGKLLPHLDERQRRLIFGAAVGVLGPWRGPYCCPCRRGCRGCGADALVRCPRTGVRTRAVGAGAGHWCRPQAAGGYRSGSGPGPAVTHRARSARRSGAPRRAGRSSPAGPWRPSRPVRGTGSAVTASSSLKAGGFPCSAHPAAAAGDALHEITPVLEALDRRVRPAPVTAPTARRPGLGGGALTRLDLGGGERSGAPVEHRGGWSGRRARLSAELTGMIES